MVTKKPGERKIIQIAQVVEDIDRSMKKYYEILNIGLWEVYTFAPPVLRECTFMGKPSDTTWVLALAWVGDTQLELMQPLSGESVYTRFLSKKGEGIHHIKEWVEENITHYKRPYYIDIIEEIPKNLIGKVQRRLLKINDPKYREKHGEPIEQDKL